MARLDQAEAARAAIFARLERHVDPDQLLNSEERTILVRAAARRLSASLNAARSRQRLKAQIAPLDVNTPSGI
jgi:hypothetical protein